MFSGNAQDDAGSMARTSSAKIVQHPHSSSTSSIDSKNIKNLKLSWKHRTEHPVSHAPLVKYGAVYFGDWGGSIHKINAKDGKVIWKKEIEKPKTDWPWYGFAGTGTLGEGKVFEASVEGDAFALDQESGDVLWRTKLSDDPQAGSLSAMLYYDGIVYVGLSSVEEMLDSESFKPDFRGKILALNAKDGKKVWERFLVESPQNGVPMWTSFALDADSNTLYFTTGNNYTGEKASKMSDSGSR